MRNTMKHSLATVVATGALAATALLTAPSASADAFYSPDYTRVVYGNTLSQCNWLAENSYQDVKKNPANRLVLKGECTVANGPGPYQWKAVIASWT